MSLKEVDRMKILEEVFSKRMSQKEGAKQIGIGKRQMIRVCAAYQKEGKESLISKKRGQPSHRKISDKIRESVLQLIREKYWDFKPTLAYEKITEQHQIKISLETVRKLMIEAKLWRSKFRKQKRTHQMRARRPCRGELIQIDGSPHDWFEGRAPACCLLVAIDDATGEVMEAHFVEVECCEGYFTLLENYLRHHGRPIALYSDKHGIFRVNIKEAEQGTGETQFGRAMRELGIEIICANSPQAKGRVERMNQTLQGRLIKEMRLAGVKSIEEGNLFLSTYLKTLNKKFAVAPASPVDVHRKELPTEEELKLIFSKQNNRVLSKSLELQYSNVTYQIQTDTPSYAMRKASIRVCEREGQVTLLYKGRALPYKTFFRQNKPLNILSSKEVKVHLDKRSTSHKPKENHPWRKSYTSTPARHFLQNAGA